MLCRFLYSDFTVFLCIVLFYFGLIQINRNCAGSVSTMINCILPSVFTADLTWTNLAVLLHLWVSLASKSTSVNLSSSKRGWCSLLAHRRIQIGRQWVVQRASHLFSLPLGYIGVWIYGIATLGERYHSISLHLASKVIVASFIICISLWFQLRRWVFVFPFLAYVLQLSRAASLIVLW